MNIDHIRHRLDARPWLGTLLGMQFVNTADDRSLLATLQVDRRTCQPQGVLHGGASIALAETVAGVASGALCPGMAALGTSITATHVHSAPFGSTVYALATAVHLGHTLHTWNVDIRLHDDTLISTVRVTNFMKPYPEVEAFSDAEK